MGIAFNGQTLVAHFGRQSDLAQHTVAALYNALQRDDSVRPDEHVQTLTAKAAQQLVTSYAVPAADPNSLLFALQTYYALLIKWIAAQYLAPWDDPEAIETGAHFRAHGVCNFTEVDCYSWCLDADIDLARLSEWVRQLTFDAVPPDAFKALYQDLLPRKVRHALGEYYTPDWLAAHTLDRLDYHGNGRLLDPACGTGTFLAHALRRIMAAGHAQPLVHIAGVDVNPLACLAARATLLLALDRPQADITLPIHCADVILEPLSLGHFDVIAGNPPWVNWQTLPASYRDQTRSIWQRYGLFPHAGMESILGKGKKDLSLLVTYCAADRYLCGGGKLGFVITQTALKSQGAGDGFRRFRLPATPLRVLHVDDLSRVPAFDGSSTRAAVLILQKGEDTTYPVPYTIWRKNGMSKPLRAHHTLQEAYSKTRRVSFVAEPAAAIGSHWLSGPTNALRVIRKLLGPSDYVAHSGVYTGGANAVYWLEVLDESAAGLHVRNITAGAKRNVPQVEAVIEPDLVYPLLRGTDVTRWRAAPSARILMVQDVHKRHGHEHAWLRAHYPLTYAYLAQFESFLRARAAYKRYFKATAPFYTMFNIGAYSLAPYKVVWRGMGQNTMAAAVIAKQRGKAIMSNQAMHPFIGVESEGEAHYLAACLNSLPFEYAVLCHTQVGGKSFAQPGIFKVLRVPRYQADDACHQQLAMLSRAAHDGQTDDDALTQASAALWSLTQREVADLQDSLLDLR